MPQFVVPPEGISFKDVITDFEKRLIESTLEAAGGVQKRAAELLHIKPTTLNEMIKRYEIRPRRKRTANGNGAEPAAPSDPWSLTTRPAARSDPLDASSAPSNRSRITPSVPLSGERREDHSPRSCCSSSPRPLQPNQSRAAGSCSLPRICAPTVRWRGCRGARTRSGRSWSRADRCYVQIMSSDTPSFSAGATTVTEQMKASLLSSYIAYSGPCTIDDAAGSAGAEGGCGLAARLRRHGPEAILPLRQRQTDFRARAEFDPSWWRRPEPPLTLERAAPVR